MSNDDTTEEQDVAPAFPHRLHIVSNGTAPGTHVTLDGVTVRARYVGFGLSVDGVARVTIEQDGGTLVFEADVREAKA